MAISVMNMENEKEHLEETLNWIDIQIKNVNSEDEKLKIIIDGLRKQSRGKYNEELETKEKLYNITHKNLEKYMESKNKPYFGRVDFREYKGEEETFYIGKFGLGDMEKGDEKVIDWRAPLADLYYSGVSGETFYRSPQGIINGELNLKRKFLIEDGKLKDAFDEGINEIILQSADENENVLVDEFLKINLEQSANSKLKDVVATIQKEQNNIIRTEKNISLIVQGSAGSGKTTVALHRLAYLLYRYKGKIQGEDIVVVAPNKLFLNYISDVLPNLGIEKVKQVTFEKMCCQMLNLKSKVYTKDKKLSSIIESKKYSGVENTLESSRVRGSILYKNLIDRYIEYIEERDVNIDDIKIDNYILFNKEEICRLYSSDMKHLPINNRKHEIKRYFLLKIDDKINKIMDKIDFYYEYMIARLKKSMEDGPDRRKTLTSVYDERDKKKKDTKNRAIQAFECYFNRWSEIDTENLYEEFLNDKEVFDRIIKGNISKNIWNNIKEEVKENREKKVIDGDDLAPLCYLKFKIEGVSKKFKYKHIVVDEAQDYSAFQMTILKEISINDSMTIVGDLGQGIYYYKGITNWKDLIEDVFDSNAKYTQLEHSYRSTMEIIKFANKILKLQKNNLKPAVPVLRHGKVPQVIEFKNNREFGDALDRIVEEVYTAGKKSIAVIGKTYDQCKKIREYLKKYSSYSWSLVRENDNNLNFENIIIPSYMTKGLEFDCSVIYNCSEENYGENELDRKILYVVLTRALHMEYIFYSGKKSKLIKNV
ncbi:RNA polymerase recycling motor HelD [Clostridium autoethanogenum]|uniref:UvrD-helicase domain-containing protein n=1 Tax=Clostridium autoethanogenum DSM 10061 TaxID=1341692 RepID=A0ABM5NQI3_9CLOT|nr:RNA polymerase recycling motor HelD [Clostridium autoethanogenum]AGY74523.1 UvrD-helicase domain-containing protein [Clostridium autoethanogenum DSM 10061]ALU34710.1 putative ATPase [Clostridium autoethanogenum DSM 10061]OVY51429.1 Helicase IV [Clostridium autoethanogenum]